MGNLLAYSGIVTKLRAMEAKLLTKEQFDEIMVMSSVPEVVSYLIQNTVYRKSWRIWSRPLYTGGTSRSFWNCPCTMITRRFTVSAHWSRESF